MKPGAEGTPRTDAAERACESIDALYGAQPLSRLCRALEREAAALRADRDALVEALEESIASMVRCEELMHNAALMNARAALARARGEA